MKKGFTLVEVLIVVAIIGLLSSVILVGLGGFRSRGRDARRIADLREVQSALEIYYTKNQQYPVAASWGELSQTLTTAEIGVVQVPRDPLPRERTYYYGVSSDMHGYVVGGKLESEHTGLAEDIDGNVYGVDCNDPVYCIQF
ncbi:MAG: type II secretion system protein [Patescibacteria group bacterium]